ncbi:hypothetical protein [Paraglaciecola aestuariivivens]
MLEDKMRFLTLATEIEAEAKRMVSLGEDADYQKMISLMQQHIQLAKQIKLSSPFEEQVADITDLDRRIKNYKRTGVFEASSFANKRH